LCGIELFHHNRRSPALREKITQIIEALPVTLRIVVYFAQQEKSGWRGGWRAGAGIEQQSHGECGGLCQAACR